MAFRAPGCVSAYTANAGALDCQEEEELFRPRGMGAGMGHGRDGHSHGHGGIFFPETESGKWAKQWDLQTTWQRHRGRRGH